MVLPDSVISDGFAREKVRDVFDGGAARKRHNRSLATWFSECGAKRKLGEVGQQTGA